MTGEARRELMIALKATQTAVRVGWDVGYPHVQTGGPVCPKCGTQLQWQVQDEAHRVSCWSCGEETVMPPEWQRTWVRGARLVPNDVPYMPRYEEPPGPDYSAPKGLNVAFFALILVMFSAVILVAFSMAR